VGNHGLEITGPQAIYCHPDARRLRPELVAVAQSPHHHLRNRAGVWVEDKGLTLTVHVRDVPPASRRAVQEQVVRLVRPALETRRLALRKGTAVVEVRPHVRWDKGEAVHWLVEHMRGERPATSLGQKILRSPGERTSSLNNPMDDRAEEGKPASR
jgi:trehalose 6-phosphate phosphatase